MREHQRDGHAVGGAVARGERVGAGVGRPQHGGLDGHPGQVRAQQHGASRGDVVRRGQHALEVSFEKPEGLAREDDGDGIAARRDVGLDGVSDVVRT